MITLFRRHLAKCKHTSRKYKKCSCPISAEGTLHGQNIRKSLDLTNWEAATKLIREWEIHRPESAVTIDAACDRFIADAKSRLREGTVLKYEQSVKSLREKLGDLSFER